MVSLFDFSISDGILLINCISFLILIPAIPSCKNLFCSAEKEDPSGTELVGGLAKEVSTSGEELGASYNPPRES